MVENRQERHYTEKYDGPLQDANNDNNDDNDDDNDDNDDDNDDNDDDYSTIVNLLVHYYNYIKIIDNTSTYVKFTENRIIISIFQLMLNNV